MSVIRNLKGMLANLLLKKGDEQQDVYFDDVPDNDDLFKPVYKDNHVYQIVRIDEEHVYTLFGYALDEQPTWMILKSSPSKETEAIFISPESKKMH